MAIVGYAMAVAVVAIVTLVGCSNSGFDWSKTDRPRPETFEAEKTSESSATVPGDGDAIVQEPQSSLPPPAETGPGPSATLEANEAGVEVSADLLPAPEVLIGTVQSFNGKYYVRVSCQKTISDRNTCSNRNQELEFSFEELSIALTSVNQPLGKVESLDHSRLPQLEYSSLFSRSADGSSVEFGPLVGPSDERAIAEIIVRLKSKHENAQSLTSYRIFSVTRETQ